MLVNITPAQLKYLQFLEKHHIKEEEKIFVTQNQAHKRFGRSNVERWVKSLKVKAFYRPRTVEYKMKELLAAAETQQDYNIQ
jgi:hypothetical protein